jgi:hypothetical protein
LVGAFAAWPIVAVGIVIQMNSTATRFGEHINVPLISLFHLEFPSKHHTSTDLIIAQNSIRFSLTW